MLSLVGNKLFQVGSFVVLVIICILLYNSNTRLKNDVDRISENFSQIQQQNYNINLSVSEFKKMLSESRDMDIKRIDSIMRANKINPKAVTEINNIHNHYENTDTVTVAIPSGLEPKVGTIGDSCWGFNYSLSRSSLIVTNKWSISNIDLIKYLKPKKLLFIRIGWKDESIRAFSDCGEVNINSIKLRRD